MQRARVTRESLVVRWAAGALLASLVLLGGMQNSAAAERRAARCVGGTGLRGSFVQLTRADAQRPRADWERLFADMAAIGIEQVFVQWTWADGVAFYAAEQPSDDDLPTLDLLFELAGQHRMRLWLGLAHDAGWWAGIDLARPASDVEVFLARRRLKNLEVARALAPQVVGRGPFAGWYIPDEIDDKNWLGEQRTQLVAAYLTELGDELAALAPGTPIAVSGFAQGWATPAQVVGLWSSILGQTPITLLLFQDGIGAEKLTLDELAIYLPLLRGMTDARGKQLGIVVELFAQARSGPGTAPTFAAAPAELSRIERQLALARRWASGPVVGFSVPNYMSDFAGVPAAGLYAGFRSWFERCGAQSRE